MHTQGAIKEVDRKTYQQAAKEQQKAVEVQRQKQDSCHINKA